MNLQNIYISYHLRKHSINSLLSQLTPDLIGSLEGEDTAQCSGLLLVLKIVSNVTSYARTVVSASGNNSKTCRLGLYVCLSVKQQQLQNLSRSVCAVYLSNNYSKAGRLGQSVCLSYDNNNNSKTCSLG